MDDIDFYLEQRNLENLREAEKRTVIANKPKESNKQNYEDQKKLKSLNNKLSNIESKINQLEKDIKKDDLELATNYDETAANPNFFDAYQKKKAQLQELMSNWEIAQEQIDAINN